MPGTRRCCASWRLRSCSMLLQLHRTSRFRHHSVSERRSNSLLLFLPLVETAIAIA